MVSFNEIDIGDIFCAEQYYGVKIMYKLDDIHYLIINEYEEDEDLKRLDPYGSVLQRDVRDYYKPDKELKDFFIVNNLEMQLI